MLAPDLAGPGGERVKLLDFGIAKLGAEHRKSDEETTRTGQILGTAAYMAPEQFENEVPVTGKSDVYSLGVVMYRMLTGRLPFVSSAGDVAVAAMHMYKPPPPLRALAPDVYPWLTSLVEQMLNKQPEDRPTMEQVSTLLQEHLPFRTSSRVSISPRNVDVKSRVSLPEVEPTVDAELSIEGDPETIPLPRSKRTNRDQSSISRATGERSASPAARRRKQLLSAVASLSLLSTVLWGWFFLRNVRGPAIPSAPSVPPVPPPTLLSPRPLAASPAPLPAPVPTVSVAAPQVVSPVVASETAAAALEPKQDPASRKRHSAKTVSAPPPDSGLRAVRFNTKKPPKRVREGEAK